MKSTMDVIINELVTPDHIGVISDYRKCELKPIPPKEESPILDFYHSLPSYYRNIKLAEIIDSSLNWFVLSMSQKYPDYNAQTFSTLKSAKQWILSGQKSHTDQFDAEATSWEVEYKHILNGKVLYRKFSGRVCIEDIFEENKRLVQRGKISAEIKGLLSDYSQCTIYTSPFSYDILETEYKSMHHEPPFSIVIAEVFEKNLYPEVLELSKNHPDFRMNPFNNYQAALNHIRASIEA